MHVFRTPAGIPLLVRRKPGAMVHAGVYVLGGARDEPVDDAGLTSLLVRTALKGTTAPHARLRSPRRASCSAAASAARRRARASAG